MPYQSPLISVGRLSQVSRRAFCASVTTEKSHRRTLTEKKSSHEQFAHTAPALFLFSFKGRWPEGFQTGGFPHLIPSVPICSVFSFFGTFTILSGDFPRFVLFCPSVLSVSWPAKRSYKEIPQTVQKHYQDLSRKMGNPRFGKLPALTTFHIFKLSGVIRANRFARIVPIRWFARIGNSSDSCELAWRAIKIGVSIANYSRETDSREPIRESPVPLRFQTFLVRGKFVETLPKLFTQIVFALVGFLGGCFLLCSKVGNAVETSATKTQRSRIMVREPRMMMS